MVLFHTLDFLKNSEKELLEKYSNRVEFKKGEVIFRQNTRTSHIMFIKDGFLKIYKEDRNGKVLILKLLRPGDFVGLMSVFGSDIHQYSAAAVDTAEVYYIDINIITRLLKQNGKLATFLLNKVSEMGLFIFQRFMDYYQKQLPGRVADVLLYFSEEIYNKDKFSLPLTRRELAELAGTTKESFIRTLTEFKNDRIIHLDGKSVEIKSVKILKKLSQFG